MNLYALALAVLLWHPPEQTNGLTGYAVSLATNGAPAHTNWTVKTLAATNAISPGQWRLAVAPVYTNATKPQSWSVGFQVLEAPKPAEPLPQVLSFTGAVNATVMIMPGNTNVIFWLRPSSLNNGPYVP